MVDAIECRTCCYRLNEIFTNPTIVKVMYDSEQSLLWLQRDFGVFMVNMFDIQLAIWLLTRRKTSFGEVFKEHMPTMEINMRYKRADWRYVLFRFIIFRKRPLTEEMLSFACSTSHFNIGLFAKLLAQLKEQKNDYIVILSVCVDCSCWIHWQPVTKSA